MADLFQALEFVGRRWGKLRMKLPFVGSDRKARWNVENNLPSIARTIEQEDPQQFEHEIRTLYPKLEKYGMKMPNIRSASRAYHLNFIDRLRRYSEEKSFGLVQWNDDVVYRDSMLPEEMFRELHSDIAKLRDGWFIDPIEIVAGRYAELRLALRHLGINSPGGSIPLNIDDRNDRLASEDMKTIHEFLVQIAAYSRISKLIHACAYSSKFDE